ncbi:MAG: hypothetical protein IPJ77_03010 [Planctomycetes bacterium]|nr:hypothetical protein [Planctomycetota bacterium]
MRSSSALVLVLLAGCTAPVAKDVEHDTPAALGTDALAACAGRWIRRGPQSILGRSTDLVLEIDRGPDGWTMRQDQVLHPGVRPRHEGEVEARRGGAPSPLSVDGDRFVYRTVLYADGALHEVRHTFRIDGEKLRFPAWVARGEREWAFADTREDIVLRTEHDPRIVASGAATLVGIPQRPTPIAYSAGFEPEAGRADVRPFVIRFAQPGEHGAQEELGRLIEHPEWGCQFVRFNTYHEGTWTRLPDAEWARIAALPEWVPPKH